MEECKVLEFKFASSAEFKERVVQKAREIVRHLVKRQRQPRYQKILIPIRDLNRVRDCLLRVFYKLGLEIKENGDRLKVVKRDGVCPWEPPFFEQEDKT